MTIKTVTKSNGYREYTHPVTGNKWASVTTVLSRFEDKRHLRKFFEENEQSTQISFSAANIGTRVHSCNEKFLVSRDVNFSSLKIPPEELEEVESRHLAYLPFLNSITPLAVEKKLVWETLDSSGLSIGFGGTEDLCGILDSPEQLIFFDDPSSSPFKKGERVKFVADYKNNRSSKSSQDFIKAYCQLAAYAAAENHEIKSSGGTDFIKHGFILSTTCSKVKKQSFLKIFYVDLNLLNFYFRWFYQFLRQFYKVSTSTYYWSDFKQEAIGYYDSGERKENDKIIWAYKDENYLARRLVFSTPNSDVETLDE